jgi:hypothetical protein
MLLGKVRPNERPYGRRLPSWMNERNAPAKRPQATCTISGALSRCLGTFVPEGGTSHRRPAASTLDRRDVGAEEPCNVDRRQRRGGERRLLVREGRAYFGDSTRVTGGACSGHQDAERRTRISPIRYRRPTQTMCRLAGVACLPPALAGSGFDQTLRRRTGLLADRKPCSRTAGSPQ